jgi:RNA polymerase sigma-70 factor (ECF subfamily)
LTFFLPVLYYAYIQEFYPDAVCDWGVKMSLTTNVTLLEKIISGDEISWDTFQKMYSPLIRKCGCQWGLNDDECDELIQEVMLTFFCDCHTFKYDRTKGRFREYLRSIARSNTFSLLKKRDASRHLTGSNEPLLDYAFDEKWDAEWHNYLFQEALNILQRDMEDLSFRSFRMYAVEQMPPAEVAAELGISVNAVYVNKSRALAHLRQTIRLLDSM